MRLLVLDDPDGGSGLDLCIRAQRDGHQVKLAIKPKDKSSLIGKGFVEVVDDPRPWYRWANLIVACHNTWHIHSLDAHRKEGGKIIAASVETAQWESNRQIGQAVLRKAGIATLPSKEFNDYDAAIAHVKRTNMRYVSKPTGDGAADADKALSYVSSGPVDMIFMLERWKRLQKLKTPFILQEFVPGVEMGAAGWFGPGGWNEGWEESFEFKKLMNDDLGPNTGEQGSIIRYVRSSKLARKMLMPLTDTLEKVGYVGDLSVNCIIDEKGQPWPLEFTCRLGWPAFWLQTALHQGDVVEWLMNLASGMDTRSMLMDKIACGVVLSIPDYPYSHATKKEVAGIPIYGLTPSLWRHWHCSQMMIAENIPNVVNGAHVRMPMPATAGDYVGVMTAVADTVKDAALTCYRRLEKLQIPGNAMWRSDIGKKLARDLPKIQKQGYATSLAYSQTS